MMHWEIHTLVFDMDDTLFAEAEFVRGGFCAAGEWLRSERGIDGFSDASLELFRSGLRGTVFDEALRLLGVAPEADLVNRLVRVYREHSPRISPFQDVQRFFRALPPVRLGLLSDGFLDVQRRKFAALNIAPFFSSVVFTDALGRSAWKPSPIGFKRVMDELGGVAEGFVYVGDNPHKDFIAPRALGWRTVRVRRDGGEHSGYVPVDQERADFEILSFDELHRLTTF